MTFKTIGLSALFVAGFSAEALAQNAAPGCDSFAWPYIPSECLSSNTDELEPSAARYAIANPKPHEARRRGHLRQLMQPNYEVYRLPSADAPRDETAGSRP